MVRNNGGRIYRKKNNQTFHKLFRGKLCPHCASGRPILIQFSLWFPHFPYREFHHAVIQREESHDLRISSWVQVEDSGKKSIPFCESIRTALSVRVNHQCSVWSFTFRSLENAVKASGWTLWLPQGRRSWKILARRVSLLLGSWSSSGCLNQCWAWLHQECVHWESGEQRILWSV